MKYKLWQFTSGRHGSVLAEAAFVFSMMVALMTGAIDYCFYFLKRSQADNISYSLASVLRERRHLYHEEENITQEDVSQLSQLATTLLGKEAAFCLIVESVTFHPAASAADQNNEAKKRVNIYRSYNNGAATCGKKKPAQSLTSLTALSPWSVNSRWIPLYQVTLTLPLTGNSLAKVGALPDNIISSSVVLRR